MSLISKAVFQEKSKDRENIQAALMNEQITRKRVDDIEAYLRGLNVGGFWRRLRWLLQGR